jgi:hypothetical protein
MSVIRVNDKGVEVEYTDPKSRITVLHKIWEQDGQPMVEDFFKGRDGNFKETRDDDEPEPAASEPGEAGEIRVLGLKFKKQ